MHFLQQQMAHYKERAEIAESKIRKLHDTVGDEEYLYDSEMERTVPYEEVISALKGNILRLDTERVRLQETLNLSDSSLQAAVEAQRFR